MFLIMLLMGSFSAASNAAGWETATPMPEERTEVAVAEAGGNIFVVGGIGRKGVTSEGLMFDPSSGKWKEIAPLPLVLHHAAAASLEGTLYVVGGFTGSFLWTPSDRVFAYDAAANRWEEKQAMPTARGALGVGVWENKLYAVGGLGRFRGKLKNVDANEAYDPKTNQWTSKAPLPKARDHLAVAVIDGKLSAIGGRVDSDYSKNMARHDLYVIKKDQWKKAMPLPKPRSGTAASVLKGRIFVFGGEGPNGTFPDNDAYLPGQDRWEAAIPLPTSRHGLGAATVGHKIYVLAGGPRPGASFSDVNEVFQID